MGEKTHLRFKTAAVTLAEVLQVGINGAMAFVNDAIDKRDELQRAYSKDRGAVGEINAPMRVTLEAVVRYNPEKLAAEWSIERLEKLEEETGMVINKQGEERLFYVVYIKKNKLRVTPAQNLAEANEASARILRALPAGSWCLVCQPIEKVMTAVPPIVAQDFRPREGLE